MPDVVNPQITDSVTQANTKVLGDAPAVAMGNLMIATSQALSNAAHNAVNAQQQGYVTMQAATVQAVTTMLSIDAGAAEKQVKAVEKAEAEPHHKPAGQTEAAQADLPGAEEIMRAFAHALQDLNEVAMRQSLYTIELVAVALAVGEILKAASPEQIAHGTSRLHAIAAEMTEIQRSLDHHRP